MNYEHLWDKLSIWIFLRVSKDYDKMSLEELKIYAEIIHKMNDLINGEKNDK